MKKIMLISSVILTIVVISMITINNRNKNEKNIIKSKEEEKEIVNSNMLTLMYETEAGSKEYVATKDNTWPEEGYIFNKNLSGCENGGELEYNSQNNTVNLLTNKSDKCYVYFDKYNGVWIDNVIATNITGSSITIDISATSENGSISKYYYRINESDYIESSNKEITINDLNKLTEYKIEVYAVDSTNAKSNIYELNVSTTDISIPIINSVVARDITYNSVNITINTTSENEIIRYYYIIDNDLSKISENNKYFVKGLMYNKEYKIFVFVEDIKGNYSEKYTLNFQTAKISLSNYIKELYIADGINNIYLHDGTGEYEDFEANDNSYRFTGGDYKKTSKAIGYNSIFGDLIKRQCSTNSNYSFYKNCLGVYEQYYYLDYDKNKTKYTNLNNIIIKQKMTDILLIIFTIIFVLEVKQVHAQVKIYIE